MNQSAQCNMIKQQLRTSNVLDEAILDLFQRLPRDQYVPKHYAPFAYSDTQIPLEHHQHMMTPSEEGLIIQALNLQGNETVLEVGTGSGYMTALLSQSCKQVITFDLIEAFTEQAKVKLAAHGCNNVEFHTANAYEGYPEKAPYDCIIMSGGMPVIQEKLLLQLAPRGRLIAFIGQPPVLQAIRYTVHANKTVTKDFLFNTSLPSLVPLQTKNKFVF
jgi:protein-L-isoaspartate(D-aspartate) O-methyltransferase